MLSLRNGVARTARGRSSQLLRRRGARLKIQETLHHKLPPTLIRTYAPFTTSLLSTSSAGTGLYHESSLQLAPVRTQTSLISWRNDPYREKVKASSLRHHQSSSPLQVSSFSTQPQEDSETATNEPPAPPVKNTAASSSSSSSSSRSTKTTTKTTTTTTSYDRSRMLRPLSRTRVPTPPSPSPEPTINPLKSLTDYKSMIRQGLDLTVAAVSAVWRFFFRLPSNLFYYATHPSAIKEQYEAMKKVVKDEVNHYWVGTKVRVVLLLCVMCVLCFV